MPQRGARRWPHERRAGFPCSAHRPARLRHRRGDARRLRSPLPALSPDQRRGASNASRPATGRASSSAQAQRIEYYDRRVEEAAARLQNEFQAATLPMDVWQQVKLHYIGLLIDHHQPECAETFFNSVTTKILHRSYFRNDFIFVRPAVSTEYIENDEPAAQPTYRAYYPTRETLRSTWLRIVFNFQLEREFENLGRDVGDVMQAVRQHLGETQLRANFQIQVLSSLFFRNKGAYVVGKIINGFQRNAVRPADPAWPQRQARDRRGALRRRRPAAGLQLRPRLLHGGDGGAFGLRAVPALADAEKVALRALQRDRPAEAGQEPLLSRLPDAHPAFVRQLPHRARHQGHGDAGVRPAELSLRVQGHQGFLSGAEGHDARADQGQVPAGQAARPRRPHGRYARVQQRRLPARPLRRRAGRPS